MINLSIKNSGYCFHPQFLESEFLPYLDAWEDSVMKREGKYEIAERKRMLLSTETLQGIRITSKFDLSLITVVCTIALYNT